MAERSTNRARTRLTILWLLAARLALREGTAPRSVRRVLLGSAAVTLGGSALLLSGVSSLALVVMVGIASMFLLGSVCLRFFPPAMAVSVVGVALSCASLMTALSVTTGFRLEITRSMGRLNGHVLLTKYGLDFFEYEALTDRWVEDPRIIAGSPFAYSMVAVVGGVAAPAKVPRTAEEAYLAEVDDSAAVDPEEPRLGPSVVIGKGIDPARASQMDGLPELMGRGDLSGLRPGDTAHLPGLILGDDLARAIGVEVGDKARVVVPAEVGKPADDDREPRHATFEVLDVVHSGTSEIDRNLALMHITAAQALFFREGRVTGIEFQLHDPEQAEVIAAEMAADLGYPFRTSTWKETNSSLLIGLEQIRITVAMILGLMVLVAASSLITSLLLVVRRKRKDIAVVMAVGGDGGLVFWTFEILGVLVGFVGATLGVAMGALYCGIIAAYRYPLVGDVYPVDHLPVIVGPVDALGPAVAAVALCAIASGPVAFLAARVGILEAFR